MRLLHTLILATLGLASIQSGALAQEKKALTIGATAGPNYDQVKLAIKPILEKKGYTVKLVEFNDYVQPNLALAQGSLDANVFQHIIYLKKFSADKGLNLVDVVKVPVAPLGIYSKKHKSLAELKDGDRITLPNDPSNLARALVFLEQQGLVKVKASIDPLKATREGPRRESSQAGTDADRSRSTAAHARRRRLRRDQRQFRHRFRPQAQRGHRAGKDA